MPYIVILLLVAVAGFIFMRGNTGTVSEVAVDTAPKTITETVTPRSAPTTNTPTTDTEATTPSADGTPTMKPATTQTPSTQTTSESAYTNGTYNSKVTYLTPKKSEYGIDVTLMVKDDVVTSASVAYSQGAEKDPNAQRFEKAYKTEVVGKKLGDIALSRVGGASLTTNAFNKALAEVKAEAQS
jgi:hypothetical protein